mmetsp:Transcript_26659/g.64378  ORF Transcript_26659/g.64378 Transcript_26659/m.64378 type:complete len:138 (-) Transcript_26659:632-1045(-)
MKRLSDEENRGIWRGSEDGSKLLQTLRDAVREAVDVTGDCGVYEALSYLAEEYLSAMMLPEIQSDELCRQAADWVQNMFVLSGLFHDLEGTWCGDSYGGSDRERVQKATRPRKLLGKNTRVVSETLKTQTETVQLFQ